LKSSVSGVAGAIRVDQLTMAGLTRAEKHGKRLDGTGKARAINDEAPVTTTGLELNALYLAHVKGAFIPVAKSKAMHVIVQFPADLVDGSDASQLLHHARKFVERVFGADAIFADRVDRDEKSQRVVDLFVAPRYLKKTARQEKVAVSMTRHLKDLSKRYGHPPIPHGTGRALQDAWFEYMRDEMKLDRVQRGSAKQVAGSDWKSAEQLRAEELADLTKEAERLREDGHAVGYRAGMGEAKEDIARLQQEITQRERQLRLRDEVQTAVWARIGVAIDDAKRQAVEAGKNAEADARAKVEKAEQEAEAIEAAAAHHGRESGLADARAIIRSEQEATTAEQAAARRDREAAAAELAAARSERSKAEADLQEATQELQRQRANIDERKAKVVGLEMIAGEAAVKARALEIGIEAWAAGDIVEAKRTEDGGRMFVWRDETTKYRLKALILPALDEVWRFVAAATSRMAARTAAIEAEARKEAGELVSAAAGAAKAFWTRYEAALPAERQVLEQTRSFDAVTMLAADPALQGRHNDQDNNGEFDDLLLRAAQAGLAKGAQVRGGASR